MSSQRDKPDVADEDQEKVIFSNAFSTLSLDEHETEEDDEDDNDRAEQATGGYYTGAANKEVFQEIGKRQTWMEAEEDKREDCEAHSRPGCNATRML